MFTNLHFFLQHPLLSGWLLYITAREGFLWHETSGWAAWESRLPIFKWVGKGSLVYVFIIVVKASNQISCWSLSMVVNHLYFYSFSFYLLFLFLVYHPTSCLSYPCIVMAWCKIIFSFFSWHSIVKSSFLKRGRDIF